MPKNQAGARRVVDRWVVSSILHMLRAGGFWRDVPIEKALLERAIGAKHDMPTRANADFLRRTILQAGAGRVA